MFTETMEFNLSEFDTLTKKRQYLLHYLMRGSKGSIVNRACPSLNRGSLEITPIVPLNKGSLEITPIVPLNRGSLEIKPIVPLKTNFSE